MPTHAYTCLYMPIHTYACLHMQVAALLGEEGEDSWLATDRTHSGAPTHSLYCSLSLVLGTHMGAPTLSLY